MIQVGFWAATCVLLPIGHAQSDPQLDSKAVIASRISQYRELGTSFKNVNDELRSGSPQPIVLRIASRQIIAVARAQYAWFPQSSGPQSGVKTHAKAEIWREGAKFKEAQDAFAREADNFAKVALSGDIDRIRRQARTLGEKCRSCHDSFRTEIHMDE